MNIYVAQFYLEAGCNYPFSHHFQLLIGEELTKRTIPSDAFIRKYAEDFKLTFRISAKSVLREPEVLGPTVFKKRKAVEYSIFLPFDADKAFGPSLYRHVLKQLLEQIINVLKSLEMDTSRISEIADDLIERIIADPKMFQHR